jgi:hypothetical protein
MSARSSTTAASTASCCRGRFRVYDALTSQGPAKTSTSFFRRRKREFRNAPELSRAMTVVEEAAASTLVIVPPLRRSHATQHRLEIHQRTIADRTAKRRRRHVRGTGKGHWANRSPFAVAARALGGHPMDGATVWPSSSRANPACSAAAVSLSRPAEVSPRIRGLGRSARRCWVVSGGAKVTQATGLSRNALGTHVLKNR